jgi:hypothetical protein
MPAIDELNDLSWSLLEKVHLANFFEDKNIPPLLFPLVIIGILVISAIIFFIPPSETLTSQDYCGDTICDGLIGEDLVSCPSDCSTIPASLDTVKVIIEGDVQNQIEVTLETEGRNLIQTISGMDSEFYFSGVPSDFVIATVRNPENGETFSSNVIPVEDGITEIPLLIPDDFFKKSGVPPKATLRILLKDADTGANLMGEITLYKLNGESRIFVDSSDINGAVSFTVDASIWYKVSAKVPGYPVYEGNKIMIEPGKQRDHPINLRKPDTPIEAATLTVCVKDNRESFLSGQVTLYDMASNQLESKLLSGGCAVFETTPQTVLATTTDLPENCIDTNSELILTSGDNDLEIIVSCPTTRPSYARIKLINESNETVTQDALITMWYSDNRRILGSGTSWSLALGDGGYTEYMEVDPTKTFYFIITNLDGYATTTTETYSIDIGANKSISVTVAPPPPPLYDITINGLTYTDTVATGKQFPVTISRILFGQTDITHSANLTVQLSGENCEVSGLEATCTAPQEPGEYDLAVTAMYEGQEGVQVVQVRVLETGGRYFFHLIPHALLDKEPPLLLNFDIKFNGSLTDSLTNNDVTIYYELGGIRVDKLKLSNENITFSMRVDTPFPGDHTAEIYLQKIVNEKLYEQNFTHYFESEPSSPRLTSVQSVNPRILKPRENFFVYMRIKNAGKDVPELENVHITIEDKKTNLDWDDELKIYVAHFTSPSNEGIYTALFEIEFQELASLNFYVIDTNKDKSSECSITQCEMRPDVRICVDKHKNHDEYTEQDTARCIESGWSIPGSDISCLSGAGNRGDWNADCALTGADLNVHENALKKIPNQVERNEYQSCGDMDNDGDVDQSDQTCLSNVISTKWFGEVGDGTCDKQMNGGFCYDIGTTSILKGDFDDSSHIDDADITMISVIMGDVSRGIDPPQELLDFADFNQDGRINNVDKQCLMNIKDGDQIPIDCVKIYNFGCGGRGDLSVDQILDSSDLLLESFIVEGRLEGNDCADLDNDSIYTERDYLCLAAMIDHDVTGVEEYCISCIAEMMGYPGPTENGRYVTWNMDICHDGLDNDCDDMVDEGANDRGCDCGPYTPWTTHWDVDGDPKTYDFKVCRALSWRNEGQYDLYWYEEFDETECSLSEHLGRWQMAQERPPSICVLNYPEGFKYPDTEIDFQWWMYYTSEEDEYQTYSEGTIGSGVQIREDYAGATLDVNGFPICASGWNKMRSFTDSGHNYTICRFEYDSCQATRCGESGSDFGPKIFFSTANTLIEACPDTYLAQNSCNGPYIPGMAVIGGSYTPLDNLTMVRERTANYECKDNLATSCGGLGGTCGIASIECLSGYTSLKSSDCDPCCVPSSLC